LSTNLSKLSHHISEDLKLEIEYLISVIPLGFEKYYLDIGSHDGRTYSNTYYLDNALGWNGILVEPILHLTFLSRKTRTLERNYFINAACVGPDYKGKSIKLLYCDLMTVAPEISENSGDEWVAGGSKYLPENQTVAETYSRAITPSQILQECHAPKKIALFSIDVEGAEVEVLKGIDFGSYSFAIILLETAVDSYANQLLIDNGYSFYMHVGQNRIFLNNHFKS
jgi:hypothetical protein